VAIASPFVAGFDMPTGETVSVHISAISGADCGPTLYLTSEGCGPEFVAAPAQNDDDIPFRGGATVDAYAAAAEDLRQQRGRGISASPGRSYRASRTIEADIREHGTAGRCSCGALARTRSPPGFAGADTRFPPTTGGRSCGGR
jgi:hypothetical protein